MLSKWLESALRDGDLITEDRLSDLIITEIEKPVVDYANTVDTEDAIFNKISKSIAFRPCGEPVKAERSQEDDFKEPSPPAAEAEQEVPKSDDRIEI